MLSSDGIGGVNFEDAFDIVAELLQEAVEAGMFHLRVSIPTFNIDIDASETERILGFRFQSFKEPDRSMVHHYLDLRANRG